MCASTMGGEPTFVSIDDMDGAEEHRRAGPHKRDRAEVLLRRLWQRFAPGGCCITARASGTRRPVAALGAVLPVARGW